MLLNDSIPNYLLTIDLSLMYNDYGDYFKQLWLESGERKLPFKPFAGIYEEIEEPQGFFTPHYKKLTMETLDKAVEQAKKEENVLPSYGSDGLVGYVRKCNYRQLTDKEVWDSLIDAYNKPPVKNNYDPLEWLSPADRVMLDEALKAEVLKLKADWKIEEDEIKQHEVYKKEGERLINKYNHLSKLKK